jgi:ribosomal protein L7Ae-like RNA K-turn-binding protein
VVVGTSGVRAELQRGNVALVVVAGDRSPRTDEKVGRLAQARGIPVLVGPGAAALGRQIGRTAVQAVGVRDAQLAAGIRLEKRQAEG